MTLFRSPTASQGEGGALGEDEAKRRGNTVGIRDQAMDLAVASGLKVSRSVSNLPTPMTSDRFTGTMKSSQQKPGSLHSVTLAQVFLKTDLFPTPAVSDNRGAAKGEVALGNPKHRLKVEVELIPTTRVSMANGATQKEVREGNPKKRIETEVLLGSTNWGRFEPAIRRWENLIGRSAPAPTKPDGKDDAHRLSSLFTEWLMGLPEGWITGLGLKRTDELKLAGNGVVPQQAELALRILLDDDNLLERIKK